MVNSIFAKIYSSRDNYVTSHLLHSCSRGMEISRRYQIPQNNQHKPSRSQSYCWTSLACYLKKLWRKLLQACEYPLPRLFTGFSPCSEALAFSNFCQCSMFGQRNSKGLMVKNVSTSAFHKNTEDSTDPLLCQLHLGLFTNYTWKNPSYS